MFATRIAQDTPANVYFGSLKIPAVKTIIRGRVTFKMAWDRSVETARIVYSWDKRPNSNSPMRGSRVCVRVEIGHGAMAQCLGETYITYEGKNRMLVFGANYGRSKGLS